MILRTFSFSRLPTLSYPSSRAAAAISPNLYSSALTVSQRFRFRTKSSSDTIDTSTALKLRSIYKLIAKLTAALRRKPLPIPSPRRSSESLFTPTASSTYPGHNYTTAASNPIYVPPRYPIVLCHGLFGYDKLGPKAIPWLQRHYWSGIKEALEKLGATVITTAVPATGDVVERANVLNAQIEEQLAGRDVNLVGHSMGGLDCRYLAYVQSQRGSSSTYRIRSLTTIATPHRGSSFMDWCRDNFGLGWAAAFDNFPKIEIRSMKGRHPDFATGLARAHPLVSRIVGSLDYPAYGCLTTDFCNNVFNNAVPDVPGVMYYSYGASTNLPVYDGLRFPLEIVKNREGPNDGIVSVASAKWGKYWETLEADHFDLTKRCRGKVIKSEDGHVTVQLPKGKEHHFDAIEFFYRLATRLYQEGH